MSLVLSRQATVSTIRFPTPGQLDTTWQLVNRVEANCACQISAYHKKKETDSYLLLEMSDSNNISTNKTEPWEALNLKLEKLTNSVYGTWSNELSNLLIFASLFSAILTAFTVEAAKAIQIDPVEKTASLLEMLVVLQLQTSNPQAGNITINLQSGKVELPDTITPRAQQIYLLYSVSLTLSLIAVLGGITCFQWLREFSRNVAGVSPSTDIYVQFQRHKSLRQWRVVTLLNMLPILLLTSLFLFFAGFLTSQWELGARSAKPVAVLVAIATLFGLITSFLPGLQLIWLAGYKRDEYTINNSSDKLLHPVLCPYHSPQAWVILSFLHYLSDGWASYDKWWIQKHMTEKLIYLALTWVATEFNQSKDTVVMVYQCFISAFSDTYCEYLKSLPERGTIPDSTNIALSFSPYDKL